MHLVMPELTLHMNEFQKLVVCIIWVGKLVGQSYQSLLSVAIAAGVERLPALLKLLNLVAAKRQEWQAMKQLPVPVELGKEFQFHSSICVL